MDIGDLTQNLWSVLVVVTHLLQMTLLLLDGQGEVFLQLGIILLALLLKLREVRSEVKGQLKGCPC